MSLTAAQPPQYVLVTVTLNLFGCSTPGINAVFALAKEFLDNF